jgi:hypothetical protein
VKLLWQILVWGALAGLVISSSALFRAHAATLSDPVHICAALRDHISLANIETALEATGLTPYNAGTYAGIVIKTQCPDQIGYVIGQLA